MKMFLISFNNNLLWQRKVKSNRFKGNTNHVNIELTLQNELIIFDSQTIEYLKQNSLEYFDDFICIK